MTGGGTPSTKEEKYWLGTMPWISSSDLIEFDINKISETRFISNEAIENSATKIVPAFSILVVTRVGLGKVAVNEHPICTSQDFTNLYSNNINPYYFAYLIQKHLSKKVPQGSTIKGISSKELAKMNLTYPTKNEQDKIYSFLHILDKKIDVINSKIAILKKYKEGIMIKCYELAKNQVISLSKLVKNNIILLGRGEIIPKQNGTFPVYSSSAANNGLFCFRNKYSFDEELITWSIDGGGKPFLRNKHKFSITNVCGYAKILDLNIFSYSWLYINFWNSWRKIKFDYTTKAHPSVIEKLYKIKSLDIESQMKIEKILTYINNKIDYLIKELNDVTLTKESLLRSLFF